jgi:hypothetical protein
MKWLRYKHFKEDGIFNSRMTMMRAIQRGELEPGTLISPNIRAWTEQQRDRYIACRPTSKKTAKADRQAVEA